MPTPGAPPALCGGSLRAGGPEDDDGAEGPGCPAPPDVDTGLWAGRPAFAISSLCHGIGQHRTGRNQQLESTVSWSVT